MDIKKFTKFIKEDMNNIDFQDMENWIGSVWKKLDKFGDDEIFDFFDSIEDEFGVDVSNTIDRSPSAKYISDNKDAETKDFVDNFESIKKYTETLL